MRPVRINQAGGNPLIIVATDFVQKAFNLGMAFEVNGTINYTLQYTLDDIQSPAQIAEGLTWWNMTGMTNLTANAAGALTIPCTAVSILINSYIGNANIDATFIQASGGS